MPFSYFDRWRSKRREVHNLKPFSQVTVVYRANDDISVCWAHKLNLFSMLVWITIAIGMFSIVCLRLKSLERWQVGWYDSKVGRSCVCVSWIEQNHQIRYNHFFLMIGRTDWTDWIPLHHFAKLLHSPTYYLNECSVQCCHIEQNYFIWEKSMSRNVVPKDYLPR